MTNRYPITSEFLSKEEFRNNAHLGIDFAMKKNTELRSIQNGVIDKVINHPSGLGKAVYVKWVDGKTAIYGHMNKITVSKGDNVKIGELLGYSGNTGNVVGENGGYHLHFALKDDMGNLTNPKMYVSHIQEMNHDLLAIINQGNNTTTNSAKVFTQAMDLFNSSLSEMKINLIAVLVDYSPFVKGIKYFF